jgi:hypothetical protein
MKQKFASPAGLQQGRGPVRGYSSHSSLHPGLLDSQETFSIPSTRNSREMHDGPITDQPAPLKLNHPLAGIQQSAGPSQLSLSDGGSLRGPSGWGRGRNPPEPRMPGHFEDDPEPTPRRRRRSARDCASSSLRQESPDKHKSCLSCCR